MLEAKARAEIKSDILQGDGKHPLQRDALALIETCEKLEARLTKAERRARDNGDQAAAHLEELEGLRRKTQLHKEAKWDAEKREKELRGLLSRVSKSYCIYSCPNISPDGLHNEVCRNVQAALKE